MSNVTNTTTDKFQADVLDKPGIVVVDFWATWCGPCKLIAPVLDTLSEQEGAPLVVKVDVDTSPELAQKYNIMSVPTLAVFKDGQVVERILGYMSRAQLDDRLAAHQ